MKVHNFCLTYQKGLFWSGQQTQTLQQWGKTNSFAQQVNIECAIQGKTSNFESSGENALKSTFQIFVQCWKMSCDVHTKVTLSAGQQK